MRLFRFKTNQGLFLYFASCKKNNENIFSLFLRGTSDNREHTANNSARAKFTMANLDVMSFYWDCTIYYGKLPSSEVKRRIYAFCEGGNVKKATFQFEKGNEGEKNHVQFRCHQKSRTRGVTMKNKAKDFRGDGMMFCNWSPTSRQCQQVATWDYVMKKDTYVAGPYHWPEDTREILDIDELDESIATTGWREFQKEILRNLMLDKLTKRSIWFVCSKPGVYEVGKSSFMKWLCVKGFAKMLQMGDRRDMMQQACNLREDTRIKMKIKHWPWIMNIEADGNDMDVLSWKGVEAIRDGMYQDNRNKTCQSFDTCRPIIVLCNKFPPIRMDPRRYRCWLVAQDGSYEVINHPNLRGLVLDPERFELPPRELTPEEEKDLQTEEWRTFVDYMKSKEVEESKTPSPRTSPELSLMKTPWVPLPVEERKSPGTKATCEPPPSSPKRQRHSWSGLSSSDDDSEDSSTFTEWLERQ